jgi:hypothetical protein
MGKIIKSALAIVLLFSASVFGAGLTALDILTTDTGIRAIAMGGAYTAAGNDPESIDYNPAGLAQITSAEAKAFYDRGLTGVVDLEMFNAIYAQPLETEFLEGYLAVQGIYRGVPGVMNPDAEPTVDSSGASVPAAAVAFSETLLKATYAFNAAKTNWLSGDFTKNLNMGVSLSLAMEQIGPFSGSTLEMDAGAQYLVPNTSIRLGASIMNLGLNVKVINDSAPIPLTIRLGAADTFKIDKNNMLLVSADAIQDVYDYTRFAVGAEDRVMNVFAMRVGYNTSLDTRNASYLSAGFGVILKLLDYTAAIDYTYRMEMYDAFASFLSDNYFGLGVKF